MIFLQLLQILSRNRWINGLIDIGLLLEPIDIEKYEFVRLNAKEHWVVLMPPSDPLAEKEHISAKELSKLPLILPRRLQIQSELASWFGDYYKNLHVVFTSNLNTMEQLW